MSRTLSAAAMAAITAAETGECFVILVTIDHADLAAPIRVNTSGADLTSNGNLFQAFPFDVIVPDDPDSGSPRAKLTIDNVDRQIVLSVRQLNSAPALTLQVVRLEDPDTIETEWTDFKMSNISYDAMRIEGDLTIEDFTTEPFPAAVFSPQRFPGLF